MSRTWLLTSTTYGTWLPGDERGFVSRVRDKDGHYVLHNIHGEPYDRDMPGLRLAAKGKLKCAPILLTKGQAVAVAEQFLETATHRGWGLITCAVMANHFHSVVEAPDEVPSADILGDLKSYASRRLNRTWRKPVSGTWWTESGSRRSLPDADAIRSATRYVRDQFNALVVWIRSDWARMLIEEGLHPPKRGRQPPDCSSDQGADAPRSEHRS